MMSVTHILLLFLVAATYMAAGRMVFTHTSASPTSASPLNCFVAGVGVWFVWCMGLHGVLGVSLPVVWYTFLVSVACLSLVLTRILHTEHENALFWPKVVAGVVLALPAFWVLRGDGAMLWAELGHSMKNMYHFLEVGGLPTPAKAEEMGITGPVAQMAVPLLSLPVMVMSGSFLPAVPALFALLIFVLAGAELARQCQVQVRWHNLVALSVVALFAVSVLNPFFLKAAVLSAYPDALLAAALFALSLPLMRARENAFPSGLGLVPYGFMLALLGGLTPLGVPLAVFYTLAYGLLIFKRGGGSGVRLLRAFAGLAAMVLLAAAVYFATTYAATRLGYTLWWGDMFTLPEGAGQVLAGIVLGLKGTLSVLLQHASMGMVLLLVAFMAVVRFISMRFGQSLDDVFAHKSQVAFPLLMLVVYPVLLGGVYMAGFNGKPAPFTHGPLHYILQLQFIFLTPLWVWAHNAYRTIIPPQSDAISGGASAIMGLLFVVFLGVNSNTISQEGFPALNHTLKVADAMRADDSNVGWAARVAVLDGAATKGYYATALAYGLKHHAYVRPVLQPFADAAGRFDAFHDSLLALNFDYLWVHATTPDISLVLGSGLRPDTSYLFKVTPAGLRPTQTYSHAGYTFEEAAYVPKY